MLEKVDLSLTNAHVPPFENKNINLRVRYFLLVAEVNGPRFPATPFTQVFSNGECQYVIIHSFFVVVV